MTRTVDHNRAIFLKKASWIRDQEHFDQIMELFPLEQRQEIYDQVQPLLKANLVLNPRLLVCPDEAAPAPDPSVTSNVAADTDEDNGKPDLLTADDKTQP